MPTIRVDVAYDGTGFRGYARQEGVRTVQGRIESALAILLGHPVDTSVAGRTDAGVHARGQVVSFVTDQEVDPVRLAKSLNGLLGPEIAATAVALAEDGFHARHSATWRRYRYRIGTADAPDPLTRVFTWEVGRRLDTDAMASAVAGYLGEHDFSAFCRSADGRSNIRRVEESRLGVDTDVIEYWVTANAFCHQMVRSLVGYAYDVGRGFCKADVEGVLESRDRSRVATVAPPHGLTLWSVGYPD